MVSIGNIDALKLEKFPVYIENNDGLNAFHIAAKENQIEILNTVDVKYKPDTEQNKETIRFIKSVTINPKFHAVTWKLFYCIKNKENIV